MPDEVGGVAEAIALVTSGDVSKFHHSILVSRRRGLGRHFLHQGVPVHAITSLGTFASLPIAPCYPFVLSRRSRSVDLIVHHSPFPLTDLGLMLGVSRKRPVLVHWHADLELSKITSLWMKPLLWQTLRRADRIIVPHESVMHNSPYLREFSVKCVVIPYGIDINYWSNTTAEEKNKIAEIRRAHPRLIVTTGRLVPYKGHRVLLNALQQVDATLCIIGTGSLAKQLSETVRELQLGHRVILAGWQERQQLKIMLHAARVFAFSSLTSAESFGIAQLEAMAARLPVVNTALSTAVPHVSRHGFEGLTVPPGNVDALAMAITKLLDDGELAERFGRAAQHRAQQLFDRGIVLTRMEALYDEITTSRAAADQKKRIIS